MVRTEKQKKEADALNKAFDKFAKKVKLEHKKKKVKLIDPYPGKK